MANTTKLKPRRVNSFNEPSDGKNLGYKNDDQFKWQDGGGGHQSFFKTQAEYDALPASKESDGNLYIIVDNHNELLEYAELILLTPDEIVEKLNSASQEYINKYSNDHIIFEEGEYELMEDVNRGILTKVDGYYFWTEAGIWKKIHR